MSHNRLDSRINNAISFAAQRSQPRFEHYFLGSRIQRASVENLAGFCLEGEIALMACFAQYVHRRCTSKTGSTFYGTLRTRVLCPETYELILAQARPECKLSRALCSEYMLLFVGALLATRGSASTYDWFIATFGPILDDVFVAYDAYQAVSYSRTSTNSNKRKSEDGEDSDAKRVKYTHSERNRCLILAQAIAIFSELELVTTSALSPVGSSSQASTDLISPNATLDPPQLLDQINTIFRPAIDTAFSTTPRSFAAPLSTFSTFAQSQARDLMAGVAAFAGREVEAYNRTAGGKSILSLPLAFYDGFMSALVVDAQSLPQTATPSEPLHPSAPGRRFPLPYRRSRAPSPPSSCKVSIKTVSAPSRPSTSSNHRSLHQSSSFQIHYSLRSWYPDLNMHPTPTRPSPQAGPSLSSARPLTSSLASGSTAAFGLNGKFYQQRRLL
ncbi:hypothetical protein DFH09DRAFT_195471 [Mycena vulgaris]|nr:hypothetical protein DFH09DRAFT_195471 [Mycena vulgaris]